VESFAKQQPLNTEYSTMVGL